ncbi:hypothetical protein KSS87_001607 [Heliosperma pusillum]|nr:hypothetical protein KSS87_001607 [Heliosperma pusillum]
MGEPAPLTKQELASKLVQEIAKNGEDIPSKFRHENGFPEAIDVPDIWKNSLLVINHGIETSFLEELIQVGKQFFALPLDEKLKCSAGDDIFQGYGTDSVYSGVQTINWNDRLFLTLYPRHLRNLQFYPNKPDKFSGMIEEYSEKLATMTEATYKAMARSLGLGEDCFLKQQGKNASITGRFGYYPRCPCPQSVLGIKPHSDGTCMTILLPDNEVDGLQVQKDEVWYKVPVIPGALFINFGDLGEVMTNGLFKSAIHRVVTNLDKDRLSLAAFCTPEDRYEIGPLSELITDDQPQMYKKFDIHEYRRVFFETYAQGLRPLDVLRL